MKFLSAEPHGDFLRIIWDTIFVSDIALFRGMLYQGSSVIWDPRKNSVVSNITLYPKQRCVKGHYIKGAVYMHTHTHTGDTHPPLSVSDIIGTFSS